MVRGNQMKHAPFVILFIIIVLALRALRKERKERFSMYEYFNAAPNPDSLIASKTPFCITTPPIAGLFNIMVMRFAEAGSDTSAPVTQSLHFATMKKDGTRAELLRRISKDGFGLPVFIAEYPEDMPLTNIPVTEEGKPIDLTKYIVLKMVEVHYAKDENITVVPITSKSYICMNVNAISEAMRQRQLNGLPMADPAELQLFVSNTAPAIMLEPSVIESVMYMRVMQLINIVNPHFPINIQPQLEQAANNFNDFSLLDKFRIGTIAAQVNPAVCKFADCSNDASKEPCCQDLHTYDLAKTTYVLNTKLGTITPNVSDTLVATSIKANDAGAVLQFLPAADLY